MSINGQLKRKIIKLRKCLNLSLSTVFIYFKLSVKKKKTNIYLFICSVNISPHLNFIEAECAKRNLNEYKICTNTSILKSLK